MKLSELIQSIKAGEQDGVLSDLYGAEALEDQKERYISVIQKTIDLFGDQEGNVYSAPGRTEVGGNHTDHQNGRVLAAAAISRGRRSDHISALRLNSFCRPRQSFCPRGTHLLW